MLKNVKSLEAEQMIQSVLAPHERLLWSGVPRQGFHPKRAEVLLIVLGLIWAGLVVFSVVNALQATHVPMFIQISWMPLVLIGAYCFFGRFLADKYRRSRTWYGVTDQRVVSLSNLLFLRVQSLPLRGLHDIWISQRGDGNGTIWFGRLRSWSSPPCFDLDTDAREVHDLILEAQRRELVGAVRASSASDLDPRPA